MNIFSRLRAWYRNWRHPVRLTLAQAQHIQNQTYRKLLDEMSGLPPVMHGEAGFVPVSYYDGRPCKETEIGSFSGPLRSYTEEAAKMYEEKNDPPTDINEYRRNFGSGFKVLAQVPEGEIIKHMIQHQGRLLVGTDKNIYELKGSRLELLNLEFTDDQQT